MKCRAWLLAVAVLCGSGPEVKALCWEEALCRGLISDENILECLQSCSSELTSESPPHPEEDARLHPPGVPTLPFSSAPGGPGAQRQGKRSYSMEHFRWGKPVGRKRRPIKVYSNGVEEESDEAPPTEARRGLEAERDGALYGAGRFRWSDPPASKRYGGFMKSWDERGQRPLLTLFKSIINKDAHRERDH